MKCGFKLYSCVGLLQLFIAGVAHADNLFSDNFNRPNSQNVSASSAGMTGTLAPLTYFQSATTGGPQILNQSLQLGGYVSPLHNFVDPSIVTAGGFSVSFTLTPPDTTDQFGDADWGGVAIGYSLSDMESGGPAGLQILGNKAFGVIFRGSGGTSNEGQISIFGQGSNNLGNLVYDQTPTPHETYQVNVTFLADPGQQLFVSGQTVTATISVTGQLTSTPGITTFTRSQAFSWIGSSDYLVLEGGSTTDNAVINGLSIASVPEPLSLPLLGIGGALAMFRRRRQQA